MRPQKQETARRSGDEIFSQGAPNLLVVGNESLYVYELTRQLECTAETWGCVLLNYPECPQFSVSRDFHQAFSVLASDAVDATRWVSDELIQLVLACWLNYRDTPFILMMLRGKVYLQLEISITCDELAALSNSVDIFRLASTSALRHFPKPVV